MSEPAPQKTSFRMPDGAVDDLLQETRVLKRRVNFWQRTAWLLLGALVIFGTVIWQRGELRRRECSYALHDYGETALKRSLGASATDLLESQWQALEPGNGKVSPSHYDLISKNWQLTPKVGERLPLAVCRETHTLAFSRGRHVLYRAPDGLSIQWLSEQEAEPILREAMADNRIRTP